MGQEKDKISIQNSFNAARHLSLPFYHCPLTCSSADRALVKWSTCGHAHCQVWESPGPSAAREQDGALSTELWLGRDCTISKECEAALGTVFHHLHFLKPSLTVSQGTVVAKLWNVHPPK